MNTSGFSKLIDYNPPKTFFAIFPFTSHQAPQKQHMVPRNRGAHKRDKLSQFAKCNIFRPYFQRFCIIC